MIEDGHGASPSLEEFTYLAVYMVLHEAHAIIARKLQPQILQKLSTKNKRAAPVSLDAPSYDPASALYAHCGE